MIEPAGLRRPITRSATAEWSCASSTTTWPNVNGAPLSSEFASSTRNWSAAVHRRLRPPGPKPWASRNRSTSLIGWTVGHALVRTLRSSVTLVYARIGPGALQEGALDDRAQRLLAPVHGERARQRLSDPAGDLVRAEHEHARAERLRGRPPAGATTCSTTARSSAASTSAEPFRRALVDAVDAGDLHLRHAQVERGALLHAALAERRQHVADVVEEHLVRSDDQHAVAQEAPAMLEQQVRGAVQADRGLAGARPALHDEALVDRRADHDVLLRLDRGDDLAHRAGARRADLGEHRVRHARGRRGGVGIVERLVEVRGDVAVQPA